MNKVRINNARKKPNNCSSSLLTAVSETSFGSSRGDAIAVKVVLVIISVSEETSLSSHGGTIRRPCVLGKRHQRSVMMSRNRRGGYVVVGC